MSVVQIGSWSDFELLIRGFLVLKCRCVSAYIATKHIGVVVRMSILDTKC